MAAEPPLTWGRIGLGLRETALHKEQLLSVWWYSHAVWGEGREATLHLGALVEPILLSYPRRAESWTLDRRACA